MLRAGSVMLLRVATTLALLASAVQAQLTGPAITVADLRRRVSIIADDSTMGRETGSYGDDAAARYVEREFRRLGLEPAGDSGGFFQTVPIVARRFEPGGTAVLAGHDALRLRRDYLPFLEIGALPHGRIRALDDVVVVYGGEVGDTLHALDSTAVRGRFVLLGLPLNFSRTAALALYADIPRNLREAAGIGLVALDWLPGNDRAFFAGPVMRIEDGRRDTMPVSPMLLVSAATAARLLGGPTNRVGAVGGRITVHVVLSEGRTEAPARNVVAVLRGRDAARLNSYVAISAHHDHVGFARVPLDHDSVHAYMVLHERFRQASPTRQVSDAQAASILVNVDSLRRIRPARPDSIYNGADDDASGTAALLELAERLASRPTRLARSVLFLSHTGEERGLLGSGWFSDYPTVSRDSIVATIDMDMIGRGTVRDLASGGSDYLELIGTRRRSTEYGNLIDSLNARRTHSFRINYAYDAHDHPEGDWCRADHYSLARYGIPVAAFSTGYHGDYHKVTDDAQYLDYPHLAAIAGFVGDLAVAVANRERRPTLDKPSPTDPHGRCVQ